MSERVRMFRHGMVYAAARLAPKAAGFVMLPVYAIYLGREGYGALSILDTVGAVVAILLAQGQAQAQFRLRFKYEGADRRQLQSSIFWYTLASIVLGLAIIAVVGPALTRRYLEGISFFPLVVLAVVSACARNLTRQYTRDLQAQQKAATFFAQSVGQTVLATLGALALVVGLRMGVRGRVLADFVAAILFTAIAAVRLRPSWPWRGSWKMVRQSVAFGVPLMWHELASWVNNLSDRLLVNHFLGLAAAGVYAMGYKFASVVDIVGLSLNAALSAQMYRTLKGYDVASLESKASLTRDVQALARSQLVQVALLAACVGAFSKELLILMSRGDFARSASIVPLVVAATLIAAAYRPFNGTLAYFDRTRVLPLFSIAAAASNVVLNLLLIPQLGIYGAALATLLSNSVSFALGYFVSRRIFQVYPAGLLVRVLAPLAAALAYMAAIDWLDLVWPFALALKSVGVGAVAAWLARIGQVRIGGLWRALMAWRRLK